MLIAIARFFVFVVRFDSRIRFLKITRKKKLVGTSIEGHRHVKSILYAHEIDSELHLRNLAECTRVLCFVSRVSCVVSR